MERRLCIFCGFVACVGMVQAEVIYVDTHATGPTHDGTSWCSAFLHLQDALAVALPEDRIHVADGTYRPDEGGGQSPGNRSASFALVLKSLRAALAALPNVEIREHCGVEGFLHEDGRVVGVQTAQGELRADAVVVAAGAWSGELLKTLGLELPVEPVKGQMILFKCAKDFLPAMVMADGRYAIPRRDGHILVGSTLEYEGFDKTPTSEALGSLRASAIELLPALAEAEVVKHWAGLRPGSPDGIPFIGPVPEHEGLWLNCGHFRNGLVLAPASCQLLTNLLLGQTPIVDPAPYAPALRLRRAQ